MSRERKNDGDGLLAVFRWSALFCGRFFGVEVFNAAAETVPGVQEN